MTEVLIQHVLSVRFKSSRDVSDRLVQNALLFSKGKGKGTTMNITLPIMISLRNGVTNYSRAVRINLFDGSLHVMVDSVLVRLSKQLSSTVLTFIKHLYLAPTTKESALCYFSKKLPFNLNDRSGYDHPIYLAMKKSFRTMDCDIPVVRDCPERDARCPQVIIDTDTPVENPSIGDHTIDAYAYSLHAVPLQQAVLDMVSRGNPVIEDFNLVPSDAANAAMTDADQQVMNECSDALLKATVSSGVQASSISGELTKALLDHFGVYKE